MGFRDFIKGQLIDVIEYRTDDKSILAHKYDDGGKQIMMGAKLTVRPGQMAVFINEGQMADIFTEGLHELTTKNMPILTTIMSWKHGFESPFKVDIIFISVDEKISQLWGTPSKIAVKDPDFGMLRIGANGMYNYKVVDPKVFIEKLVGTDREYTVSECRTQLNGQITTSFTDFFGEAKVTLFEAYANITEFSEAVYTDVKPHFSQFGLELVSFNIKEIRMPEVVEQAMDSRASIAAMGGMDLYQRKTMVDATAEAAVNMSEREGGTGVGGFGMEMATGMAMGNMMGNMMASQNAPMGGAGQAQSSNTSVSVQAMVTCSKCQAQVPQGSKFCQSCGNNMQETVSAQVCINCKAPIEEGAKFCSSCGAKQEEKPSFCSNCGTELAPGAKFCSSCGQKQ